MRRIFFFAVSILSFSEIKTSFNPLSAINSSSKTKEKTFFLGKSKKKNVSVESFKSFDVEDM